MKLNITKLKDIDSILYQQLRSFCFDINGCCQMVHAELGPFFSVDFHGQTISHKHYVDFFVKDKIFIECKAVDTLCAEHRQQLWNYMRLTKNKVRYSL